MASTYRSAAEHAAEIRAELKAKGWNSKQIGVRSENYSMGSSINVTIKDPSVDVVKVREIAEEHEHVRRCEMSGEILSGGNMFVFVRIGSECRKLMAAPLVEPLKAAIATARERGIIDPGALHKIGNIEAWLSVDSVETTGRVWIGDSFGFQFYLPHVEEAAEELALKLRKNELTHE